MARNPDAPSCCSQGPRPFGHVLRDLRTVARSCNRVGRGLLRTWAARFLVPLLSSRERDRSIDDRRRNPVTNVQVAVPPRTDPVASHRPQTRTVFEPGRNCVRVCVSPRASLLIDAEAYFRRFMQAALRATRSIVIIAWDFDSRTELCFEPVAPGVPTQLGAFLNFLARRRRRLDPR